jgi:hypothetical protein
VVGTRAEAFEAVLRAAEEFSLDPGRYWFRTLTSSSRTVHLNEVGASCKRASGLSETKTLEELVVSGVCSVCRWDAASLQGPVGKVKVVTALRELELLRVLTGGSDAVACVEALDAQELPLLGYKVPAGTREQLGALRERVSGGDLEGAARQHLARSVVACALASEALRKLGLTGVDAALEEVVALGAEELLVRKGTHVLEVTSTVKRPRGVLGALVDGCEVGRTTGGRNSYRVLVLDALTREAVRVWEEAAYPDRGALYVEKWVLDEVKRVKGLGTEAREALEVLVREAGTQEGKWLRTLVKAAEALSA